MGRPKRAADGGLIYHVLNRANARMTIFEKPEDFAAFERILEKAVARTKMRLLAYCVMPTHWHMVVWPQEDGELSRFTGWLTLTHTQRWHAHRHSTGSGHLYQGRFKSFPVQDAEHFFTVFRYAERNALPANLVQRAEDCACSACQPFAGAAILPVGPSRSISKRLGPPTERCRVAGCEARWPRVPSCRGANRTNVRFSGPCASSVVTNLKSCYR